MNFIKIGYIERRYRDLLVAAIDGKALKFFLSFSLFEMMKEKCTHQELLSLLKPFLSYDTG